MAKTCKKRSNTTMILSEAIALGCLIICTGALTVSTDITADEKQTPNLTSYIFLGQEISDPVPYIVSIQYRKKKREWKHFCGGSIISPNYVLTAAHCLVPHFIDGGTKPYRILAGRNNLRSRIGSRHRIIAYAPHPKYENEFKGYDIGVIKIHPSFKFNQRIIDKIEFESSERVLDDIPVVFHGWGYTKYGYPERLQEAKFTTMSEETCKLKGPDELASTDLCVISKDFSVAYLGDSGGPLVNEKKTLQIGICSYGSLNILWKYTFPTVFTRVSEFSNWIKDEISK